MQPLRSCFWVILFLAFTQCIIPLKALHEEPLRDFSFDSYKTAVENCFTVFESQKSSLLTQEPKGSVGIKIVAGFGEGLRTPPELLKAVIEALIKRGYNRSKIFIWDCSESKLRASGFLPKLSKRLPSYFDSCLVKTFDDPNSTDPEWFYESSLAPALHYTPRYLYPLESYENVKEARRSYLPVELFLDADFWVHLPVPMEHPHLGPWCALADSSFGMITNMERFLNFPAHMPIVCAEINSIPELYEKHLLTIVSLENAQFVGGLTFYPRFSLHQQKLWAAIHQKEIDEAWLALLNENRRKKGFVPYPRPPYFLD